MRRVGPAVPILAAQISLVPSALAQMAAEPTTHPSSAPLVTAVVVVFLLVVVGVVTFVVWRSARVREKKSPRASANIPETGGAGARGQGPTPSPHAATGGKGVFISYRRGDSADITGRIYDRLVQHFGKDFIFKDVDSIPLGIDFRQHLDRAVGQCRVLLAIIGRGWLEAKTEAGGRRLDDTRDHLRIEIEAALRRDIPLIPVLVQGAVIPPEQDLPSSLQTLAYRNALAVRPDPDFHRDMDRLIQGIEAHVR